MRAPDRPDGEGPARSASTAWRYGRSNLDPSRRRDAVSDVGIDLSPYDKLDGATTAATTTALPWRRCLAEFGLRGLREASTGAGQAADGRHHRLRASAASSRAERHGPVRRTRPFRAAGRAGGSALLTWARLAVRARAIETIMGADLPATQLELPFDCDRRHRAAAPTGMVANGRRLVRELALDGDGRAAPSISWSPRCARSSRRSLRRCSAAK